MTLMMNLPHGHIGLRITETRLTMTRTRQVRRWLFWKRWRTDILASKPYKTKADDVIELRQIGPTFYIATVNSEPVLRFGRLT